MKFVFLLLLVCLAFLGTARVSHNSAAFQSRVNDSLIASHMKAGANFSSNSTMNLSRSATSMNMSRSATSMNMSSQAKTRLSLPQVVSLNNNEDSFACPSGYTYLAYEDVPKANLCSNIGQWDIIRLQGGGSADGSGYGCKYRSFDSRNLGSVLCVQTLSAQAQEVSGQTCPSGWGIMNSEEVSDDNACNIIGQWDIARFGAGASLSGSGYGCGTQNWDQRVLGAALCIQRKIIAVQELNDSGSNLCGQTSSLITVQEAVANQQTLCNLISDWGIVRLAGGASIDGPGYGCGIHTIDRRSLGNAFCDVAGRSS